MSGSTSNSDEHTSKKRESPASQRNKAYIWEVLKSHVFEPATKNDAVTVTTLVRVLEVAAGNGVHVDHFATQLESLLLQQQADDTSSSKQPPRSLLEWYPTDPDSESRDSIECYIHDGALASKGVQPPLSLTLDKSGIMEPETFSKLPSSHFTLISCINMIHISPWSATLGLFQLAAERLDPTNGYLYCYGPYKVGGTAVESNLNFDQNLQSRNPEWGVRDLETVVQAAQDAGLELVEQIDMPANNLSLLFRTRK
eukprot:CAMPEP_0119024332 /NCGR_PEP_ID=MMETSP1176-20130426/31669_1 /TAXON_ID=265551 /ORGANISM="Synedropsis recta cf, Strain CCMP1620" /LENGTH=254 /DNA_ID=CAMNT_0006979599 /DNA_START=359 /DNA_END=1123 /DNA_ORIENTATION=-